MFQRLPERVKKMLDPKRRDPMARIFQDAGYVQDTEARKAQVLFFKLLMAIAYADDSIDQDEINLLKDFAFEHCLSEEEWQEIDFYRQAKVTEAELEAMTKRILDEIRANVEKQELLTALEEMVDADEYLHEQEKSIFESLKAQVEKSKPKLNWTKNLVQSLRRKQPEPEEDIEIEEDARAYPSNPAAVHLKRLLGGSLEDWLVAGAKIGVQMIVVHSDLVLHGDEAHITKDLIAECCNMDDGQKIDAVFGKIESIPAHHFELSHLARILVDECTEKDRCSLLKILYATGYVDKNFSAEEDQSLRLVARSLMLRDRDFQKIRVQALERYAG